MKLTRRLNRKKTIEPTDKVISLIESEESRQYLLLILSSCTRSSFENVVQILFRKSVDEAINFVLIDKTGKEVSFRNISNNMEYIVKFEEKPDSSQNVGTYSPPSYSTSFSDIIVYTPIEIKEMQEAKAIKEIDREMELAIELEKKSHSELRKQSKQLKLKATEFDQRIKEKWKELDGAIQLYEKTEDVMASTSSALDKYLEYITEREEKIKRELSDINADLDKQFEEMAQQEEQMAHYQDEAQEDDEDESFEEVYSLHQLPEDPIESLSVSVEESPPSELLKNINEKSPKDLSLQRLSIIEPKEIVNTSTDMNVICQSLNLHIDTPPTFKEENSLISFGEPIFLHRNQERQKMWLLLGEMGSMKISESQEFTKISEYKLKNVIKLTYAEKLSDYCASAEPFLIFSLRFCHGPVCLECMNKKQLLHLLTKIGNAIKYYNPNSIVPSKDSITTKIKAYEARMLLAQKFMK